jgi:hypothetical protein
MTENVFGRTGGPYLDIEEAKARELKSARIEDREPDFSAENLFPMTDHTVKIPVDPTDDESVAEAREKINELVSPEGTQVSESSADEAPMSSPVLAVGASAEDSTPFGQVKTEEGTSDSEAVEEEAFNSEEVDANSPANTDTTADTNTDFSVDTEAPSSNPDPVTTDDNKSNDDPFADDATE